MFKNIFIGLVLVLLINTAVTSQNLTYGVKAGMNLSKFSGNVNDPFSGYDGKTGFHYGWAY